jgi:hypothetical protein
LDVYGSSVLINLENLQYHKVIRARYQFTQGISGTHYFYSHKDMELYSLSKEGALSEDEELETVFSFRDQFEFSVDRVDFKLSKDESKLKMITEHLDEDFIGEYIMTETTQGEGFTNIDQQPSTISDVLKDLGI